MALEGISILISTIRQPIQMPHDYCFHFPGIQFNYSAIRFHKNNSQRTSVGAAPDHLTPLDPDDRIAFDNAIIHSIAALSVLIRR